MCSMLRRNLYLTVAAGCCFLALMVTDRQARALSFTGPVFGWELHLPGNWKIEQHQGGESISGAPVQGWMFAKNPMTYVAYQVEDYDIRDNERFASFMNKNFSAISATMQVTAENMGAQTHSSRDDINVGGQTFRSIIWVLQAPGRPDWKSVTLVGSIENKAVTFGLSCTGADCDELFEAFDNSRFTGLAGDHRAPPPPPPAKLPAGAEPDWNFTIPVGWTRVPSASPDDRLAIEKGEDNSLTYSLIYDEDQELQQLTIEDIKGELFGESMSQFQAIAHENGLLLSSEEEITMLGDVEFHTISIGLMDPQTQEPVIIAAQFIAVIRNYLAMIGITCVDEQSCDEIQQAVELSSFR